MNHYPHHLGDYAKDTLGLSTLEHGAYRLLLDAYYASEEALAADEVHAIAKAGTPVERKAVDKVLKKFELRDGRYYHKRVEQEIAAYRERSKVAAEKAQKRWRKDKEPDAPAMPQQSPGTTEAILASSHKPEEKQPPKKRDTGGRDIPAAPAPSRAVLPSEFPKSDDARVIALHGLCLASRVRASILDAQQWVSDGITEEVLTAAIHRGHDRKSGEALNVGFLQCMVRDVLTGAAPSSIDPAEVVRRAAARIAAKEAGNATH